MYVSFLGISGALHLAVFEQPLEQEFFSNLLKAQRDKGTEAHRDKVTEGKDNIRSLLLCPSVPLCLCPFVPLGLQLFFQKGDSPLPGQLGRLLVVSRRGHIIVEGVLSALIHVELVLLG